MFRRRDEGASAATNAYQMHQKMFAIGDDFWIEDGAGHRAFKVDGKALRVRKTLILEDAAGNQRYLIKEKLVSVRDVMTIETPAGTAATVRKAMFTPLRERFEVELASGAKWDIQGNIVDHQYEISSPGGPIAEVSKKWARIRDTYGVRVAAGQDDALVLAVAIVVDQMTHGGR